mmetsp:Transcript_82863/g.173498  ORF Transcript_82863/g.173498 Transcript_82863/m.173498 type:complete len:208 (+) Transcript_82863:958-1581(+)
MGPSVLSGSRRAALPGAGSWVGSPISSPRFILLIIIITRAEGLLEPLRCSSIFSSSVLRFGRSCMTSDRRCTAESSRLYFLPSSFTSRSTLGRPVKVPSCISLILTIKSPFGDLAVSMISSRAIKSCCFVSSRFMRASERLLATLGSIWNLSTNACTAGSSLRPGSAPAPVPPVGNCLFMTCSHICLANSTATGLPLMTILRGWPTG